MFSRYEAMKDSQVKDPADKDNYPDPLSINYNNVVLTELPGRVALTKADFERFWLFMSKQYKNIAEADDVLLIVNDVPYLGMLQPGDYLYLPVITDLYGITKIDGLA